ncbi:hypothetical protein ACSQ67_003236 [Phaseolus vulgaris]
MLSGAPRSNLRQVKSFLRDDFPSKDDKEYEDPLLAKTLPLWPSTADEYDDFPPGFEGNHFLNRSKDEFSRLSQIKWERPPSFALNSKWRVATGEESRERNVQSLREMRVLEAVYPRISSIPSSPSVSFDVEMESYDDSLTPHVPLIPIEELESLQDRKQDVTVTKYADSSCKLPTQILQKYIPLARSSSEVDLFAAYATVAAAIMKSNEENCLIDINFLLETVNDPIKIGNLIEDYISAITTTPFHTPTRSLSIPTSCNAPDISAVPLTTPASTATAFDSLLSPTPEKSTISSVSLETTTLASGCPLKSPESSKTETINTVTQPVVKRGAPLESQRKSLSKHLQSSASSLSSQRGVVKDVNYYLNLVRDHDNYKKDMRSRNNFQDSKKPRNNTTNQEEAKFKIHKPCKYFKTSRGCRNGSNCRHQHEMSVWRM